ncbi:UNVERIFIED_ORG: hypothetical protein B2H93_13440 [Clostridium botulinum]
MCKEIKNELIKISEGENGKKLVSARELHEFLGVKSKYVDWIKNRINKYEFIEDEDFTVINEVSKKLEGSRVVEREQTNHAITIDMAKELSMVENNSKGRQARKYFIQCEKSLKEVSKKALLLEKIYEGGQDGILASKQLTELEVKEATTPLIKQIEEDKPMVEFTKTVLKSSDNILVRQLSKIAQEQGMNIGEKKLYNKLREWGYILKSSTEPTQKAMNQALFVVEEKSYNTPYGTTKLNRTTKVTPKGQIFIIEKLRKEFY